MDPYDSNSSKGVSEFPSQSTIPEKPLIVSVLGSGKTILSANVVENLMLTTPAAVISYFFCKHDEAGSLKARTIIGSIARQLFSCVNLEVIDWVDPINKRAETTNRVPERIACI